jgi:hypothetical protein
MTVFISSKKKNKISNELSKERTSSFANIGIDKNQK